MCLCPQLHTETSFLYDMLTKRKVWYQYYPGRGSCFEWERYIFTPQCIQEFPWWCACHSWWHKATFGRLLWNFQRALFATSSLLSSVWLDTNFLNDRQRELKLYACLSGICIYRKCSSASHSLTLNNSTDLFYQQIFHRQVREVIILARSWGCVCMTLTL